MNFKLTRLYLQEQTGDLSKDFKSGVSLHCHTQHSRELLEFVPHVAAKLPVIKHFWEYERKRYEKRTNRKVDLSDSFWTPPLSADKVYNLEREQINRYLGLEGLVSLTDHDEIAATLQNRRELEHAADAPISLEWTVPFEGGFFHVGVHNLPESRAHEITKDLLDLTFAEKRGLTFGENRLTELFTLLNEIPQVLIVLNHPLWDIEHFGKERHAVLLDAFLAKHSRHIHAFEINGFRSWSENFAVLEMADAFGFPVVSGGDRHGCQPNAVVNLTTSRTFDEFAEQIRRDKHSRVVLMPNYSQPLGWRQLETFADILRYYPDYDEARKHWLGRVHVGIDERGVQPLSFFWRKGGPKWLKAANWTLAALGSPAARPLFKIIESKRDRLPSHLFAPKLLEDDESFVTNELSSGAI